MEWQNDSVVIHLHIAPHDWHII